MPLKKPIELKKKFAISIIAHRGYKKHYPENTLLSFAKAIEAKADYIELDIHLSKDQQIVVSHDSSTKRTGNGKDYCIAETDLATLKTVDIGQGEKIPTLEEVFQLCKGKIGVQIEIKAQGSAEPMIKLIQKMGMEKDVLISSFNHNEIQAVKALLPEIPCGILEPTKSDAFSMLFNRSVLIKNAQAVQADGIHPLSKFVNRKLCEKAHESNLFINPWTVDSPKEWEKLIAAGVDGIITNDPQGLYDYLSKI